MDWEMAIDFRDHEQIFATVPSGWASNAEMVPQKDIGLLAGRAFAFVLRTRGFAALWLWQLKPIERQNESLNNLQLRDDSFKDTIRALVQSHFKQRSQQASKHEYDVVRGKGKGLVILLHGAPGVGTTSTAESVAAASGKPLFSITCGDLGLTPSDVERALKEIFRYAQLWNCVLLLDECDIFLSRRSKDDIKRNGLVSVFLRTLEFYTGVLFLTTNRVGMLDDAMRSRLTWTAYYPPLDGRQSQKIWKVNMRLLKERNPNLDIDEDGIMQFAKHQFRNSTSKWNGRQIQNAYKVASALADYDDVAANIEGENKDSRPRLTASHFEVIANGTKAFDDYLEEVTGFSQEQRAYNNTERADHIDPPDDILDPYTGNVVPADNAHRMSYSTHVGAQNTVTTSTQSTVNHRRRSSVALNATYQPYQSSPMMPAANFNLSPVDAHQTGCRFSNTRGMANTQPSPNVRFRGSPMILAADNAVRYDNTNQWSQGKPNFRQAEFEDERAVDDGPELLSSLNHSHVPQYDREEEW